MSQSLFTLLSLLSAVLYVGCGIRIVSVLRTPQAQASAVLRWIGFAAFLLQAAALAGQFFGREEIRFGFGLAVSAILFFAIGITLVESLVHRITGLLGVLLIVAGICSIMPVLFSGSVIPARDWTMLFRLHLLLAIASYSFITIACIQAIFLARMNRQLKGPMAASEPTGLISNMPNLMAMERILFRIVACGFVCLTALLVTGVLTTYQAEGMLLSWDHKTILSILAWVAFAVLLIGRRFFGWRNRQALTWFWVGVAFLSVAYVIYRLIIELVAA